MKLKYYLVEEIDGNEYNIYSGSEKECNEEMKRILNQTGYIARPMYVSSNRWD